MTCAVVSVNRALGVLGIAWMLMSVGSSTMEEKVGTESTRIPPLAYESAHGESAPAQSREPNDPCKLDEARGLHSPLCLAITQPNKKNARETNGR